MEDKKNIQTGTGFLGLLCIAFIVLKLTHVINWSWVWVLAPIWIELLIVIVIIIAVIIVKLILKRYN